MMSLFICNFAKDNQRRGVASEVASEEKEVSRLQ